MKYKYKEQKNRKSFDNVLQQRSKKKYLYYIKKEEMAIMYNNVSASRIHE